MADRPAIAIISNSLTPYRLHFHQRIVRELPSIELWSLFTHDQSNAPWGQEATVDIRPIRFGPGEASDQQARIRNAGHEWRKGGCIIRWLHEHNIRAVVLLGYNDLGRLRILRWCHRCGLACFLFGDSNIRGDLVRGLRGGVKRLVLPRILSWTTGVMPCGSLGQAYFRRYGVSDDRMFLMPYEPDYDLIGRVSKGEVDQAFEQFHLPRNRRYVLYSGRLIAIKRVDLLIDAFITLASERPDCDLLLVGDGPLRSDLERRVPSQLHQRVHWLGFIDNPETIARIYRGSHVLVLPSDNEPWGVVVNEAVAAGLALICSAAVGAAAELVRDRINGRLFPSGDLHALTECLRDVTNGDTCAVYGSASSAVLTDWRQRGDPVQGLRAALEFANILIPRPE